MVRHGTGSPGKPRCSLRYSDRVFFSARHVLMCVLSGFHTSGLPSWQPPHPWSPQQLGTRAALSPGILRPVKLSLRNLSQLGVILTVLLAELLELLQHLAQLGFESFGRQSGLARLYQHALKQLCGFSECLLRLSVISKLGLTHLHTQHLDLNLCPPAVGCALFSWVLGSQSLAVCSWVLGSQSWLFVHGVLGSQSLAV